ncbi:hypothetical protein O9993_17970 [Vibrio lentus]|nr:hypothetical protein [Vibrio lentus]
MTIGDDVQLMQDGTITSRELRQCRNIKYFDVMPNQSADGAKVTSFCFLTVTPQKVLIRM